MFLVIEVFISNNWDADIKFPIFNIYSFKVKWIKLPIIILYQNHNPTNQFFPNYKFAFLNLKSNTKNINL